MSVQSSDKVERIFEATFELVAEHGIHNTPVSAISKRSGVATGTIYHYFDSKETLINALYLSLKESMLQAVMAGHDAERGYKARFFRIWLNYYNYLATNGDVLRFVEQCASVPIITAETQQQVDAIVSPLLTFFEQGIRGGTLKLDNVHLVISLLHGSVVSLAKLQLSGHLAVTDEVKASVAEFNWKGLT